MRHSTHRATRLAAALLAIVLLALPASLTAGVPAPSPPRQPLTGPGGSDYAWPGASATRAGTAPEGAWVYRPEGATADDLDAFPVVLFLHGFTAVDPGRYFSWIEHLTRRGIVVIYPDYQEPGITFDRGDEHLARMLTGIEAALAELGRAPDRIHVVGHSLGGALGTAYVMAGPAEGLPPVATLTVLTPGGCASCGGFGGFGVDLPEVIVPEPGLLVHVVTGADDRLVGDGDARAIWAALHLVPPANRRALEIVTDRHGEPPLVADHLLPQSGGIGGRTDALDWYGLWRPLDALIACAERGETCEIALGTDDDALTMGTWSDGTPVATPTVHDWS